MKKIYASIFAISLVSAGIAQSEKSAALNTMASQEITKYEKNPTLVKPNTSNLVEKGAVLWSDDFSTPANWTLSNTSIPALDWSFETDPAAIPVSALSPMGSATAANGYLFINSDGAVGNADNNGTPIVVTAQNATPIDLTGKPAVVLTFASNFRWWQEDRTVRVSGDNGSTWTDFEVSNGSGSPASGQNTNNPTMERFDISAVAGDSAQVLVQFVYNDNDMWGWYWAVDDVAIVEKDPYDISSTQYFATDITNDFEYAMVPLTQASPMSFGLDVENIGSNNQTGVGFSYDINDGSSSVSTGSAANTITLAPNTGIIDTVFETTTYTPAATGTYTYTLIATSDNPDSDMSNNEHQGVLEITNGVWSVDNGALDGSWSRLFDADSTAMFRVGNEFLVQNAGDSIWSIDVEIAASSMGVGEPFFVEIWKLDAGTGSYNQISTSQDHVLTANEVGQWVNVDFDNGIEITSGDQILAFAGHYGGSITQRISFARGGKGSSVRLALQDNSINGFIGKSAPPHVRLNLNRSSNNVGIEENTLTMELGQNFPNPFNGVTTISYTLTSNETIAIEVTDVTGKVIAVLNQGTKAAGSYTTTFDSSNLEAGVYFYTLSNGTSSTTKSMTITK